MTESEKNESTVVQSIDETKKQLTKRNDQYLFELNKILEAANYSLPERDAIIDPMVIELVEKQKSGVTARQLYGTLTEYSEKIISGETGDTSVDGKSPAWQIGVDGGLLLGGIFALISGISLLINQKDAQPMGLITLLMNFIAGGLMIIVLSNHLPTAEGKKGKKGYFKYLLVSLGVMAVWLLAIVSIPLLVPASLNIALPAAGYIIIGAVAILGKIMFKKHFDVRGTIF
ncbi:MAG: DUF1129 domain-containing protein [Bavariicoccus seileri]|uniref:DUF1129 domain-containing protein n=1 Tax=Bavariicoccus seileri TaxID=549685 RepID=UPI003F964DEE